MFGIGLPEMILILALALIVVGPDKLPDLARSLAKGMMELKKTAEGLKDSLSEESNIIDDIRPDLEEAAKNLKNNLLDAPPYQRDDDTSLSGVNPPADNAGEPYQDLIKQTMSPEEQAAASDESAEGAPENTVSPEAPAESPKADDDGKL